MPTRPERHRPDRRRFIANAAALAAVGLLPSAHAWAAPCRKQDSNWIPDDAFLAGLPGIMKAFAVPGVGIAVVDDGVVAWSRGFGVTNAVTGTPVDARTVYEDASLSKPVFAYLVMQLVDQGRIDLDKPLVQYRRPDYLADHPWIEQITPRDVLRHTTGLPNWRSKPATEKLVPMVKPGTRIDYSGEAIFWLQLAVEAVTGQSLDDSMREHLFGPAGMDDSSYTWNADLAARSVYGHRAHDAAETGMPPQMFREQWSIAQQIADRWGKPLSAWKYEDAERALPEVIALAPAGLVTWPGDIVANAAASLRTTVQDYAKFTTLMMAGRKRAPWEIREATRQAMLTPQIDIPGRYTQKGLGWNMEPTRDGPVFYHSGSNGGIFKNFALGDAQRGRGIVVLTNGGSGSFVHQRVVRAATGYDLLSYDL
ncbi:serine hydrolase domain-containing protein [Luteibacter sp.]|uniref:serine hydrolase domain-containing protein n=1 Tax=Luteibacter sp. TaxID=1886636 RepID=UPI00280A34D0|nr:serine hydrolase domain-containing protein [Luteibacter sp.]MDQ8051308.1 serine hydrolase domain-containing protein [Luteibacter sp.]